MDRRSMIRATGMGVIGLGLQACASRSAGDTLPRVRASWDRVIRTSVGLRPHRPRGLRLETERVGEKTVIHNYGHGGAGVSLSWGTGHLATVEALRTGERRAAVIGAGAVGLATARVLQRHGLDVTIYTRAVWPDESVCSGHAPARFTPGSFLIDDEYRTPEFDAMYERAASLSYRYWHDLAGTGHGVDWRYAYSLRDQPGGRGGREGDEPDDDAGSEERSLTGVGEAVLLEPGQHPFPSRYALRRMTLVMDTPVFLEATLREFLQWGGQLVIRRFDGPGSVLALEERLIVNCSGVGAREVWGEKGLEPLKGQLTLLVPQAEVDFVVSGGGFSMVPRSNCLLLGGAGNSPNDWSMEPDLEAEREVVERAIEVFDNMRGRPDLVAILPVPTRGPSPDEVAFSAAALGARATRRSAAQA